MSTLALRGSPASHTHRLRRVALTGLIATLAAMVATTLGAALAHAAGVDFEVPDGGETIPLLGFIVAASVVISALARSLRFYSGGGWISAPEGMAPSGYQRPGLTSTALQYRHPR